MLPSFHNRKKLARVISQGKKDLILKGVLMDDMMRFATQIQFLLFVESTESTSKISTGSNRIGS